jgi:DNA repair protein RecN (Recombination protein N)
MLRHLSLRDFVIVDALEIEFEPGFTVLTGETGAGKSILVDALALALGGRGEASVVREGATRADIGADFDSSALPGLQAWLTENALDDDSACLLRRVIDSNGRSRCFINGRSVTAQQLREAGEFLVDIHGQHAHQSLLKTAAQRDLLDSYGGLQTWVRQVAETYRQWRDLHDRLNTLRDNSSELHAERERLQWLITDVDALEFTPVAWDELQAEHRRLANAASLVEGVGLALDSLSEGEAAAEQQIGAVGARLAGLAEYDSGLQPTCELVESAVLQLQEATHSLRRYLDHLEADPDRLREVESRIELVLDTARKHRVKVDQLPELLSNAHTRLGELGATADPLALEQAANAAHAQWLVHAEKLSVGRAKAAKKLATSVTSSIQQLALAGGAFEISLTRLSEGNAYGLEQVEFMVAPHAGTAPKPLAKVASGGELSRISLALQTAVSQMAGVPTLIFDEVDVGIGGGVAEIVGTLLKNLSASRQVLCITHLPQVAACGQHHLLVSKVASEASVVSHIAVLDVTARVDEIARMLGGVTITDTTRKHAAEMLNV